MGTSPWCFSSLRIKRNAASLPRRAQEVEDLAVIIDSTPQIHLPTSNCDEDLVGMPLSGRRAQIGLKWATRRRIVS
jgi:hypothetical protein